jgi:hypothetical protein
MYTFTPIATVMPDHTGFGFIVLGAIIFLICVWASEDIVTMLASTIPTALVVLLAYCVSYVWTDQGPVKVYKNEMVTGQFVRYVAEGYNETVRSGKSTRHVDRHEVYVVYRINGNDVLFRGREGVEYPRTAVFYKN